MKFIPPMEIASKVMTLIEDADQYLVIVSPYVNITNWDKMKRCLQKAKERNVEITFFARKNTDKKQDFSFLEQCGIKQILIQDLHAKIYLNEKSAIVTSQNMIRYSDDNSIDVGYHSETAAERIELEHFINKHLGKINTVSKTATGVNPVKEHDNILKDAEVELIYQKFIKKFWDSNFKRTATYVFSDELLPFGDVMIDNDYTVKFRKSLFESAAILKKLAKLDVDTFYTFQITVSTSHNSYNYIHFIPKNYKEFNDLNELVKDYVAISKKIIEKIEVYNR